MSVEKFKKYVSKKTAFIYGGLIGLLISIGSMFVFSALILFFNMDRTYSVPFSTISVALGSFCASKITAKKIGDKGYLIGGIVGLSVFLLLLLLSVILGGSLSFNTFYRFIIIILSSIAGGIVGVNSKKNKKYI